MVFVDVKMWNYIFRK